MFKEFFDNCAIENEVKPSKERINNNLAKINEKVSADIAANEHPVTKKFFTKKRIKNLTAISLAGAAAIAFSIAASSAMRKVSDPLPAPGASSMYKDESYGKVLERDMPEIISSEKTKIAYSFTANLSDLTVDERADSYGTHDVYVDEEGTEYSYLYNSDVFCGYLNYSALHKLDLQSPKKVSKNRAEELAREFIGKCHENYEDYKLISWGYTALDGYYDLSFQLPIDGIYDTDEIFRVWITKDGEVVCFTDFNCGRYKDVKVDAGRYEKALKDIDNLISSNGCVVFEDSSANREYISKNDNGKLILVKQVSMGSPLGDGSYSTFVDEFTQIIG